MFHAIVFSFAAVLMTADTNLCLNMHTLLYPDWSNPPMLLQAIVTGKSPLQNLEDHLAEPFINNGFLPFTATKFDPSG